jgi:putative transcriptional regulator
MTKAAFESIRRGLKQAIAHQQGRNTARVHRPEHFDVQALRAHLKLTQEEFAARFGISLGTLRHWERGDRAPHGTALVLLQVIKREPRAVLRALADAE